MNETNLKQFMLKNQAPVAHEPVVIIPLNEYNELVKKAAQNTNTQHLLRILADLGCLSEQMKELINEALPR